MPLPETFMREGGCLRLLKMMSPVTCVVGVEFVARHQPGEYAAQN